MEARGLINCYRLLTRDNRGLVMRTPTDQSVVYTINLSHGTTPFCKMFDGKEHVSSMYLLPPNNRNVTVTYGWYRPCRTEWATLINVDSENGGTEYQDYILRGGLICAPLDQCRPMPSDPVQPDWTYEQLQQWALSFYGRRLPSVSN